MFSIKNFKYEKLFFIIGFFSVLIGFFLNENSSGGAQQDFIFHYEIVKEFKNNFLFSLRNYDTFGTNHSPIFIILLLFLKIILVNDSLVRFFHIVLFSTIPLIFFKCLKEKFHHVSERKLFIFSTIIFLSPNFRSLLIWPGSEIISIFFLTISIYYFLRFELKSEKKFIFVNIFFLVLAAYFRPIYSLFGIFFYTKYFLKFKFSLITLSIIIFSIILAFPAIYYLLYVNNFIFSSMASYGEFNISNKILIISSIIFFHLIPFLFFFNDIKIRKKIYFIIILAIFSLLVFSLSLNFNFNIYQTGNGGGFFLKISNLIFSNNYLFYLVAIISLFTIFEFLWVKKFYNFLLIAILFSLIPHNYFFHEYYEPLLLILLFTLFDVRFIYAYFNKIYSLWIIFIFYTLFYSMNLIKNFYYIESNILY